MSEPVRTRLQKRFGLPDFHPWQKEAIDALLNGDHRVLVVAPTGGGKSLCYQFPATELPGMTLVVCPLIALMEDQVRSLRHRGIAATYLSSTLSSEERQRREEAVFAGQYQLVYVAPERLSNPWLLSKLRRLPISFVAIDEAHCISQWGHDFRPDYLGLGRVLEQIRPAHVMACTATATPAVREEILRGLGLQPQEGSPGATVILRGFSRPNLHLAVRNLVAAKFLVGEVHGALCQSLGAPGQSEGAGIVYAGTRKKTEEMAAKLRSKGWEVEAYHAGLDAVTRADIHERFVSARLNLIVATNAFGMGIDRPDVRIVVHAQLPGSIEAYYQEVGRAGRDGRASQGLLLSAPGDIGLRKRLIYSDSDGTPETKAAQDRQWALFRHLLAYVDAASCRHDLMLRYFGDEQEMLGGCGHCDVCLSLERGETEIHPEASTWMRMALSGVARCKGRIGLVGVAEVLRGDTTVRTRKFDFQQLSTFGLMKMFRVEEIITILRRMIGAGLLDISDGDFPVPVLSEKGVRVMKGESEVSVVIDPPAGARRKSGPSKARNDHTEASAEAGSHRTRRDNAAMFDEEGSYDTDLFEALRHARSDLAKQLGVPAFTICHDRTMRELAARKPTSDQDLLAIHGLGPGKVEKYGDLLLAVCRAHQP